MMKCTLVLMMLAAVTGYSRDDLWSARSGKRPQAVSLNGAWEFTPVKPLKELLEKREGSFDPPSFCPEISDLIPENIRISPRGALPTAIHWVPIAVPAAWEQAAGIDFNGAGWYRRSVDVPADWMKGKKRIWVEFDAVATGAAVWLNGRWLGGNVGDYVRWRVEATGIAKKGRNELLVYVDELPGHITQGFLSVIAPHHGGIWQYVRMFATGGAVISPDGVSFRTNSSDGTVTATVAFNGDLSQGGLDPKLRIGIYDPMNPLKVIGEIAPVTGSSSVRVDSASGNCAFTLRLPQPALWTPAKPFLYVAEVSLGGGKTLSDRVYQTFAFRDIAVKGSTLLLNGKEVTLHDVLTWGYYPRVVSPAPPPDIVRGEFEYIKSLGFNGETVCLVIMPDYFYELADELGILLWEEYPTWHNEFTQKERPTYQRMFPAFFRRDRNHPSIVLRSMSVEAGVKDKSVMAEIVRTAREMTGTPVQDNNSWFWLSDLAVTDWYGEDNYWNNDRYAAHYMKNLPAKLDTMPVKPYIIGESIAGTVWIDTKGLSGVKRGAPFPNGVTGTDRPHKGEKHPYWYPAVYESCLKIEEDLRRRYNHLLGPGEDIVEDYLVRESRQYSLEFRKFQIQLLLADPRYAGWTLFLLHDTPTVHSGLFDDLGKPRWQPSDWKWLKDQTLSAVARVRGAQPVFELAPGLKRWDPAWGIAPSREIPLYYFSDGYSDPVTLFHAWPNAREIRQSTLAEFLHRDTMSVLVTSVLTHTMVDYMKRGGAVILLTSRWDGALTSRRNMFWAGAFFAPPVGPFTAPDIQKLISLHQFDLTHDISQSVNVKELGIAENVDPMIRFFELHDQKEADIHDALFATQVGKGLFIASALDHNSEAGEWVMGKIASLAHKWIDGTDRSFPRTSLDPDTLLTFAVPRPVQIIPLTSDWKFRLDSARKGEGLGWMKSECNDSSWVIIQAGMIWENQGYDNYDGMAWYRKTVHLPPDLKGRKVTLVAEGVDDAYKLYVNGTYVAMHGSFTEHSQTVFMTKTQTDVSRYILPDANNCIVLQVVDITGGGGINSPIYLKAE